MEHLRDKFHEELTAKIDERTGNVLIGESVLPPFYILKGIDEEGYEEAFNFWLNDRNQKLLNKADEILNLYDNRVRFISLQAAYQRETVIPFVGAGMSMPSGYPGWTSFLKILRKETRIPEAELDAILKEGKYEEAAEKISDSMRPVSFNEALGNYFSHDHNLKGPILYLPFVFNTCAITTNFDNVLKRSYDEVNQSFSEVLLGADAVEIRRLLGSGEKILVKLHGKANSGHNRVLTYTEYQRHYGDKINLKPVIEAICSKTLLFLGCSLNTDRTIKVMKDLAEEKGHGNSVRHYAFLSLNEEDDRLERRDQLADANVFPIWYPADDDHDEVIEALLLKMKGGL